MDLSGFGKLFNVLYTDRLSVRRFTETVDLDNISYNDLPIEPLYTNIPCRISFKIMDKSETEREDSNPINLLVTIFCENETDIKKGDFLKVDRIVKGNIQDTYEGIVNLRFSYPTHLEFQFIQAGDA